MSTCKDCLHCEACKGTYYTAKGEETILCEFEGEMYADSGCEHFKPKADYAPVVRCKDCAYFYVGNDEDFPFCCLHHSGPMGAAPDHFCSYGKRKESEVQGE